MSYSYTLSDDFRSGFVALPFWIQEDILDELEVLLANPSQLIVRQGSDLAVHDFTRTRGGVVHYVFLTIQPDFAGENLLLVRVGHVVA